MVRTSWAGNLQRMTEERLPKEGGIPWQSRWKKANKKIKEKVVGEY